jgi:hypothetical protein
LQGLTEHLVSPPIGALLLSRLHYPLWSIAGSTETPIR